ncbi:hypothetical protein V502_07235 [Pseudogymnoascus sp. VKM F-4520 (FW-2644)]|nr:hypothetical protein V502_07235 [Pseudogymnoascus sp. VKM F-4520 (FW-2644)]
MPENNLIPLLDKERGAATCSGDKDANNVPFNDGSVVGNGERNKQVCHVSHTDDGTTKNGHNQSEAKLKKADVVDYAKQNAEIMEEAMDIDKERREAKTPSLNRLPSVKSNGPDVVYNHRVIEELIEEIIEEEIARADHDEATGRVYK